MFRSFKESTRVRSPGATGHRGFLQNSAGSVAQICTSIIDIAHIWQANRKLCRSRSAVVQCIAFCISVVLEANIQLLTCKKLNKSFQKKKKNSPVESLYIHFKWLVRVLYNLLSMCLKARKNEERRNVGGIRGNLPMQRFWKTKRQRSGNRKKKKKVETVSSVMISFWCEFRSFH